MDQKLQYSKLYRRYALALSKIASEKDLAPSLLRESNEILEICQENSDFDKIFKSPLLSSSNQRSIVENLFTCKNEAKIKISKLMYAFLILLSKNSRLSILKGVLITFKEMVSKDNQELDVKVTSAIDLNTDIQKKIISMLEKKMRKKINLTNITDKSIIGGLIMQIGSDLIDVSVRNKIIKINTMIKGAI